MDLKKLLLTFGIVCTTAGSVISLSTNKAIQVKAESETYIISTPDASVAYSTNDYAYLLEVGHQQYNNTTVDYANWIRIGFQAVLQQDRTTKYKPIIDVYTYTYTQNNSKITMYNSVYSVDEAESYTEDPASNYTITNKNEASKEESVELINQAYNDATYRTDYNFNIVNTATWTDGTGEYTNNVERGNYYTGNYTHLERKTANLTLSDVQDIMELEKYELVYLPIYKATIMIAIKQIVNVSTEQEVIDIPGLMLQIISMPFTFISTAFNVTLFPGTQYQVNVGNFILGLIAILTILFIIKIFTGGLDVVGNINSSARNTTARWKSKSQEKLNKQTKLTKESSKERK